MNNPSQYLKFFSSRVRPAIDLIERTVHHFEKNTHQVKSILDLGCGPGNITPLLLEHFPSSKIDGIDSSKAMVKKANEALSSLTNSNDKVKYYHRQIEDCCNSSIQFLQEVNDYQKYDLVYSNAALHWCNSHEKLFQSILQNLVRDNGGVLAIQMPDTRNQKSHLLMETAALRCGLMNIIQEVRIPQVEHDPEFYYHLLSRHCKDIELWSTDYITQLPVAPESIYRATANHPILEFTRSTGLQPIINRLGENTDLCKKYLKEYNRLLEEQYPYITVTNKYHIHGKQVVLMPFKRFFIVCRT